AEFMLDVVGAGATATCEQDWHEIWNNSPEKAQLDHEIDLIHTEGRSRPSAEATFEKEFATPWFYQAWELFKRNNQSQYRDPIYLLAKLVLNIVSGLLIGFSFFKAKDTQQGTQNKLFAVFLTAMVSYPLVMQLVLDSPRHFPFLTELPWNIAGGTLYFFTWYWTVGLPNDRAGYTYLMFAIIFPMYYTSSGHAIAAMSPNEEIAAAIFSLLFSFVVVFCGVLQPYSQMGWWKWMYRISPYTYFIEGSLAQAIGNGNIYCSSTELSTITPPSGQTCGQYMEAWLAMQGGYLVNPNDSINCQFCSTTTVNRYLAERFNMFYSHRWRDVGILIGFTLFNIAAIYAFTFWFRIRTWSVRSLLSKKRLGYA
ncbi:hypothetical protein MPER_10354, partial [Moniliophthora perniciosa FA553]